VDERTLQAIVERARQGDHDAFARLAVDRGPRLHAIARLVLRDADLASDAVQETFIKAWRELPRLREVERFDAWLRRLLINACYDERRRNRLALVHQLAPLGEPAWVDGWARVEDRERLGRAFERLSMEQRVVVVLDHYVGMSDTEIAAAVGAPLGTVKARLRRAMRALRAAIDADDRVVAPAPKGQIP
jgi:RNA polymerase sigma-70 factor (ECF subfamily)